MHNTGGLYPEYKKYAHQKCFLAYSYEAEWRDDILSACAEVLPNFGLEPWYTAKHFDPTQTLRDKVVELIANSRYGIYDLSSWQDYKGEWNLPRNVYIELGIAIALNRPALLLRHTSNQALHLPTCIKGLELLEFAGEKTLKQSLEKRLPQWIDIPPDHGWRNRFCILGNRECNFREQHPCTQQWAHKPLCFHIADGLNNDSPIFKQIERDDIRGNFEDIFSRYGDLTFIYLDEQTLIDGYPFTLCSHCHTVRSTPFAIYRILPQTPAEVFIAIGMSIALETLFEYKIPKVLLVRQERDLPSLLRGYEVVEVVNTKEVKQKLKGFIPKVMQMARETAWRPRLLPFETAILLKDSPEKVDEPEEYDPTSLIPIEELQLSVRTYNRLKQAGINLVADLLDYSPEDLLEIKNFGKKSVQEVIEALQRRLGTTLPHTEPAKTNKFMDKNEATDIPISTDNLNNNLDKYSASTSQHERPNSRTLRVAPQYIQRVKSALSGTNFVRQRDLAEQLHLSLATVNNFLNGRFVEHLNFLELSKELGLDWQEIADFGIQEREDSNSTEQPNRHANRQSGRSLRVSSQRISAVKSAVLRNGFPNQEALAEKVGLSLSTVKNFLNGKPVARQNFLEISHCLALHWTALVDFGIQEPDSSAH